MADVNKWLETHHNISAHSGPDGGDVSVFAVLDGAVFPGHPNTLKTYHITFNLGPVTIRILFEVNTSNSTYAVAAYGSIPFLPEVKLGSGNGSHTHDVKLTNFNALFIGGNFTFTIKGGMWVLDYQNLSLVGRDKVAHGDVILFPVA